MYWRLQTDEPTTKNFSMAQSFLKCYYKIIWLTYRAFKNCKLYHSNFATLPCDAIKTKK